MTIREEAIYRDLKMDAEKFVAELGGEIRSRQIDAALKALAVFLARQPQILSFGEG